MATPWTRPFFLKVPDARYLFFFHNQENYFLGPPRCRVRQAYWSPCISATANLWHRRLGHSTSCIFNLLVSKNKIMCTSRRSLVQCQACPLGKSSRLSLWPTSHKTTAPLDLIFSDVWALLLCFLLMIFVTLLFLSMRIWNTYGIFRLLQNLMYFHFSTFSNTCWMSIFT